MATYAAFKHVELFNVGNAKKRVLKPPGGGSSDLFGSETPATPRSGVKNRMQSNIFAGDATKSANGEVRRTAPVDSHNRLFGDLQRPYTPAKNHMKSNLPIAQVDEPDTKQMNGNGKMNGHHNGNTNGNHQVATNGHTNGHSNGHSEQQSNEDISPGSTNSTKSTYSSSSGHHHQNHIDSHHSHLNNPTFVSNINLCINDEAGLPSAANNVYITPRSPRHAARNPVTGNGIEDYADRPRKCSSRRDGNPVTGEGYKTNGHAEINTTVPALNTGHHVINKNRIPPGGFSSGLW